VPALAISTIQGTPCGADRPTVAFVSPLHRTLERGSGAIADSGITPLSAEIEED
jgi:hypothetical protein